MSLFESGEMYLETIYILSQKGPVVRSTDIADYMEFSKPSVSRAVSKLKEDRYINVSDDGHITLTPSGLEIAEKIYDRHVLISSLLESLGVDEDTAIRDACKIEHDLSDASFDAIKKHLSGFL